MFKHAHISLDERRCLIGPPKTNFSKRFEVTPAGTRLTDDFRPLASEFSDYSFDNLVRTGAPVSDGPSFEDTSISQLDSVESASAKILEANDFIVHKDDDSSKK